MRSSKDGSSVVPPTPAEPPTADAAGAPPPAPPDNGDGRPNAFDAGFLARLEDHQEGENGEPPTASEAELAGPWRIEPLPPSYGGGYGLFRAGEDVRRGFGPHARFTSLWAAKLVASLLPGLARDEAYRLRPDAEPEGFALESREAWGAVIGHVGVFDPRLADALNVLDALMRSPWALALFLEACGKVALEKAGAILDASLSRKP
jgi:hypothetical protein